MDVLLSGRFDPGEAELWADALAQAMPEVRWLDDAAARAAPAAVEAAVVANPRPGALAGLPRLRLVQSLWAGVEKLLADSSLPADVPLARMVDPAMTAAMAQTAAWAVLAVHRGFFRCAVEQRAQRWTPQPQTRADEHPVLVLGRGELGRAAADVLAALGYPITGWSRADGRAGLEAAAGPARTVVNLLPLTPATRGILDASLFARLPRGAGLVNLARGAHLVEADLLAALASGRLGHAVLDVFEHEPLPSAHPFWTHERITVLPHMAAQTDPRSAARVVAANLRALQAGAPIAHRVDRARGY